MPYIDNQGVRIHYEVEGDGPPLVLQHGRDNRLESWYERGYVEPLKRDYRLILIDARGHGRSGRPRTPEAYMHQLMAQDVTAVLDGLSISRTHYFGYSMGGQIGYALAKIAPQRFYSLIIGGMDPYRQAPSRDTEREQRIAALRRGIDAYVDFLENRDGPRTGLRERLLQEDPQSLIAMAEASPRQRPLDDALPHMTMPCLLFVGEKDRFYAGMKECVKQIRTATFVAFPGLGHIQTIESSDLVVPHVTRFLAEVEQGVNVAS